jgi:hypothetical protein
MLGGATHGNDEHDHASEDELWKEFCGAKEGMPLAE